MFLVHFRILQIFIRNISYSSLNTEGLECPFFLLIFS
ncbi:hypothetical protein AE07_02107 [Enterobacter cloacae BWH 43]|nr:hypothetical protein AE07_02107 [Enterobacter cloacae BWH 43]